MDTASRSVPKGLRDPFFSAPENAHRIEGSRPSKERLTLLQHRTYHPPHSTVVSTHDYNNDAARSDVNRLKPPHPVGESNYPSISGEHFFSPDVPRNPRLGTA